jgi:Membrane carboxypeptidase (penicillin-binding protein)
MEQHTTQIPTAKRRRRKATPIWLKVITIILKSLFTLLLIGIVTGLIMLCFASIYVKNSIMPYVDLPLDFVSTNLSSTISYQDSTTGAIVEMRTLYGDENRIWVSYADIPQDLINATIAIEDKRFESHHGVDWLRTADGVRRMLTGQNIQGGSTITQQLIKNITDDDEVTVKRKITEIFRALEFENQHTKKEILEWYLNYIYLGENCNGVYTAAFAYFGKPLSELSLAECASLIGITNNPSLYNPYINREGNKNRQELILWQMLDQKIITQAQHDAAVAEELVFQRGEDEKREVDVFTWYEDMVITQLIKDLGTQYNLSKQMATNLIYSGGLSIVVPFDPAIQAQVDEIYLNRDNLDIVSRTGQQIQSAIAIIDNKNGNILAVCGRMDEKTKSRLFSMATDARRSPGSAFKPLSVYAPAFEMGVITPYSVYDDAPLRMLSGSAYPANAYLHYRGRMTVWDAVTDSSNPVAMRILLEIAPETSFNYLVDRFGFGNSLVASMVSGDRIHTDIDAAPLALGGLTKGVSVLEMAAAYSTFARDGVFIEPRSYLYVLDSEGKILLETRSEGEPVISQKTVYYINTLLKNVVRSGTGTEANFSGMAVAGKTGSTNSNMDRWFVGYTPYYTAAVWVGYEQQERIYTNGNPAARMWKYVMQPLHAELESTDFTHTVATETVLICKDSGMKATENCALDMRGDRSTRGIFARGDAPTGYCTTHQLVEICNEDPIVKSDGTSGGTYHLAGEFCPAESRREVAVLDLERAPLRESDASFYREVRDNAFLKITVEEAGLCTLHLTPIITEPLPFNINDPLTWPTDDPFFNPADPTTWPQEEVPPPIIIGPEWTPDPNGDYYVPHTPNDPPMEPHDPETTPVPAEPSGPPEGIGGGAEPTPEVEITPEPDPVEPSEAPAA